MKISILKLFEISGHVRVSVHPNDDALWDDFACRIVEGFDDENFEPFLCSMDEDDYEAVKYAAIRGAAERVCKRWCQHMKGAARFEVQAAEVDWAEHTPGGLTAYEQSSTQN